MPKTIFNHHEGKKTGMHEESLTLIQHLVAIDSTNPDLVEGGAGERAIADAVGDWLEERGFDIQRLESRPGRPSIVAIARGSGGGRSLMLNGHLDTVTLVGYDGDPLDPMIRDGRLYGRGSYDMKSGVVAIMLAAAQAAKQPHAGDIILALVADEEYASAGTAEVLAHVQIRRRYRRGAQRADGDAGAQGLRVVRRHDRGTCRPWFSA